jgi:hypothetical protein
VKALNSETCEFRNLNAWRHSQYPWTVLSGAAVQPAAGRGPPRLRRAVPGLRRDRQKKLETESGRMGPERVAACARVSEFS